jgi:hypothetical protein
MIFAHPPQNQQTPALNIHPSRGGEVHDWCKRKELTVCQSSDNLSDQFVAGRDRRSSRKIHLLPENRLRASLRPPQTTVPACGTVIVMKSSG